MIEKSTEAGTCRGPFLLLLPERSDTFVGARNLNDCSDLIEDIACFRGIFTTIFIFERNGVRRQKLKTRSFQLNQYFECADEIRHLTEAQIEQIYKRYLSGEKSANLKAEFQIPATVRSLLTVLPPIVSRDLTCPYCCLPMWVRRHAKGTPVSSRKPYQCVSCKHQYQPLGPRRSAPCTCSACVSVRQQQAAAQAERLYDLSQMFCRECDSPNIDVSMNKQILRTTCYDCTTISKFRAYEELPD
ncbi:hypothetical protein [Pseudomonas koreensis]|uniref:hypothetical protein n=1 Tax=Pseudomonas koreensis TaxID=198620 RepID=UPI001AA11BAC|nr:hypothetical protein [Pseudomonas koreensis]